MVGTDASARQLDVRRRRLLFRCWHRGTREMDLIMGRFADAELAGLSDAELAACERLLELPEPELFAWILGMEPAPEQDEAGMLARLRAFHAGPREP